MLAFNKTFDKQVLEVLNQYTYREKHGKVWGEWQNISKEEFEKYRDSFEKEWNDDRIRFTN